MTDPAPGPAIRSIHALLDAVRDEVTGLDIAQAKALYGKPDVVVIDLRDVPERQREGYIPGAFHCPRGMLEFWAIPDSPYHKTVFDPEKQFVLHCASGWRSALAAKTLQDLGFPRVAHIEGGFSAWRDAGGPVEGGPDEKG